METNYYPPRTSEHAPGDAKKPKGMELQQSINTNKAKKAIRVNAEREKEEAISDAMVIKAAVKVRRRSGERMTMQRR